MSAAAILKTLTILTGYMQGVESNGEDSSRKDP